MDSFEVIGLVGFLCVLAVGLLGILAILQTWRGARRQLEEAERAAGIHVDDRTLTRQAIRKTARSWEMWASLALVVVIQVTVAVMLERAAHWKAQWHAMVERTEGRQIEIKAAVDRIEARLSGPTSAGGARSPGP